LVLWRGEALGVPPPANRLLHAIVKLIESKSRIHRSPRDEPVGARDAS
jgi:hypothetical protein